MKKYIQPSLKEITDYYESVSKEADEIRNFQAYSAEMKEKRHQMESKFIGGSRGPGMHLESAVKTKVMSMVREKMAYAIFSHRWLDEGEVTYHEMAGDARPAGAGLDKLKRFCDIAMEYSCRWAWADTGCIDKTSSAQLEESIRSMYNWYANSKICIAHLRDTTDLGDMANDPWFTRGWTLQELIAPVTIKFFNKDWKPIIAGDNDKDDDWFLNRISAITGVGQQSLRSFSPSYYDLEPLFWASKRRTTRIEDMAYCLIGFFGLTLSIAYGEGKRAFFRLQMELLEAGNDIKLLTWSYGEHSERNTMIAGGPECFSRDWPCTGHHRVFRLSITQPGQDEIKFTYGGIQAMLPKYSVRSIRAIGESVYRLNVESSGTVTVKLSAYNYDGGLDEEHPERYAIVILGYTKRSLGDRTYGILTQAWGSTILKVLTDPIDLPRVTSEWPGRRIAEFIRIE